MATPFLTVFAMKYDLDTNIYRINVNGTTGFHQFIFSSPFFAIYKLNSGIRWIELVITDRVDLIFDKLSNSLYLTKK